MADVSKQDVQDRVEDDLTGYVEVSERIEKFYEDHKAGSLQSTWTIEKIPAPHEFRKNDQGKEHGKCRQCGVDISDLADARAPDMCEFWGFIVRAEAYRDQSDGNPAVGTAWEPFPGRTPFTRGAELQNAETSAWGRALAALGYEVRNGIASANEMRGREGRGGEGRRAPSEKQASFFADLVGETNLTPDQKTQVNAWANAVLTGGKKGSMSEAIDGLKDKSKRAETAKRLAVAAEQWAKAAQESEAQDKPESGGENPPEEA